MLFIKLNKIVVSRDNLCISKKVLVKPEHIIMLEEDCFIMYQSDVKGTKITLSTGLTLYVSDNVKNIKRKIERYYATNGIQMDEDVISECLEGCG